MGEIAVIYCNLAFLEVGRFRIISRVFPGTSSKILPLYYIKANVQDQDERKVFEAAATFVLSCRDEKSLLTLFFLQLSKQRIF